MFHTDVLIIGAGPTGMALSIALHQAGVSHMVVDRLAHGLNTSRAGVIHAHTLEMLAPFGVADRLVGRGLTLDTFVIRDRERPLLTLKFDRLPSRHPYLLMLPQNLTEEVLAERIAELGGAVRRGVEATSLREEGDHVLVELAGEGTRETVAARYVVGADGMHSIVREAAGIDFDGAAYEGSFVLADVHMDWPLARREVSLFFSPAGLVVVAPQPDGTYRVVATMDDASAEPSAADIQALVDGRGPTSGAARVADVVWSSRFRLHHRIARHYRRGRLFIVGDAAHVHSPAGGQGMNTGIVDAIVLGEILGDVLRGRRGPEALDLYETLRRPAAVKVLEMSGRLTAMAVARHPLKRAARNAMLSLVDANPVARRRLAMNLSGISRAAMAKLPDLVEDLRAA